MPASLLEELNREEIRELARHALAVMPVAATEQHGPHLPVGTDMFTVEHIARRAADEAADRIPVVVTPTLPFGSSHHHFPFGGTLSLTTETYYKVMCELLESLIVDGFQRIFVVNGHGGNHELIQLAVRDLALRHAVHLAATSYWVNAWDAIVATNVHASGRVPGHAGALETSQILALRPELVRSPLPHREEAQEPSAPRPVVPYRSESHGFWQSLDGYTDSPDRANAERGKQALNASVHALAQAFVEFCAATGAERVRSPMP